MLCTEYFSIYLCQFRRLILAELLLRTVDDATGHILISGEIVSCVGTLMSRVECMRSIFYIEHRGSHQCNHFAVFFVTLSLSVFVWHLRATENKRHSEPIWAPRQFSQVFMSTSKELISGNNHDRSWQKQSLKLSHWHYKIHKHIDSFQLSYIQRVKSFAASHGNLMSHTRHIIVCGARHLISTHFTSEHNEPNRWIVKR